MSKKIVIIPVLVLLFVFSPIMLNVVQRNKEINKIKEFEQSLGLTVNIKLKESTCSMGDFLDSPHGSCTYIFEVSKSQQLATKEFIAKLETNGSKVFEQHPKVNPTGFIFHNSIQNVGGNFGFDTYGQARITIQAK